MKIVCDNCATKYSIADEKVRGKVFKIRCKKCSHIIVVRGTEAGDAPADAGADTSYGDEHATIAAGPGIPAASGEAIGDSVWHLVIDREQVGPMTATEVRAKFSAGQVDAETYAWREGFGDWLRLGSIDEFTDLNGASKAAPEAATMLGASVPPEVAALSASPAAPMGDLFAAAPAPKEDAAGDLFGEAKTTAAPPSAAAFAAAASSSGDDLFGGAQASPTPAPAAALFGGNDARPSFGGEAPVPADDGQKLTGQRNENSVLFSLNNLQALATSSAPAPGARKEEAASKPGHASSRNEGSGLIDIRQMAAATLSSAPTPAASEGDAPVFSAAPVFSPVVAAPIMLPQQQSGMPQWVWGIIGGAGLLVVGVGVLVVVLVTRQPKVELAQNTTAAVVAAPAPPPAAPTPAAAAAPAPGAPAPAPGAPAPAAATAEKPAGDTKASDKEEKKSSSSSSSKKEKGETKVASASGSSSKKEAKAEEPAAPAAAPAAAPKEEKKEAPKKKGGDDLDDLLDGATDGRSMPAAKSEKKEAGGGDDESLPDQLSRGDILAGMKAVEPKVKGCYEQFKVPGTAMVQVVIGKSGKVQSATVGGALAGTPTGDCVARAVKSASFKKFKDPTQSISYPFMLR